jgi:carbamoyltransferase
MNVSEFLKELSAMGVELWRESDQLHYRAPKDILTPERLNKLKQYKEEILQLLSETTIYSKAFPPSQRKSFNFLYLGPLRQKTPKSEKTSRRSIIVGHANTFHDPAIALIHENLIFAEAIERHTQCKRAVEIQRLWYSWRTIREVLSNYGITPIEDTDVTCLSSWNVDKLRTYLERINVVRNGVLQDPNRCPLASILLQKLSLEPLFENNMALIFQEYPPMVDQTPEYNVSNIMPPRNVSWKTKTVDHHLAHAANAVFTSPFDECVVAVIDGYGEDKPMSFYHFAHNQFAPLPMNEQTASLGFLYSQITYLCGFNPWEGEEWKVMGLASYGKQNPDIYNFFKRNVTVKDLGVTFHFDINAISELESLVGGFRYSNDPNFMHSADLAYNFQKWFEDIIIELFQALEDLDLSKNLAYAGGCALNSSANGKILKSTGFKHFHVPSAPADDGNSLGVALYEKYCIQGEIREPGIISPYLGSTINLERLEHILSFGGTKFRHITDESELCSEVADLLASENIVGWVQGRSEFGPRALGNRSILADPRPADMKDRINKRVKFREQYRPLAPSILHEFGDEYFEDYQESPYMERTLVFRKAIRNQVPAVVHHDGTGRLQTVKKEWNPLYYRLIYTFYQKTGIPILLNTSFNVMGKPIIHSVEDAMTVFYTTGLDYLIIGNYILYK